MRISVVLYNKRKRRSGPGVSIRVVLTRAWAGRETFWFLPISSPNNPPTLQWTNKFHVLYDICWSLICLLLSSLSALNGAFSLLLWDYCKRHLNISHLHAHVGISMLIVRKARLDSVTLLLKNPSWLLLLVGHYVCETVQTPPLLTSSMSTAPHPGLQPQRAAHSPPKPQPPAPPLHAFLLTEAFVQAHPPPHFLTAYFLLILLGPVQISISTEFLSLSALLPQVKPSPSSVLPKGLKLTTLYFFIF